MAREFLLHSGEFVTQNDYKYRVEFYKVYDLHAVPELIEFPVTGGVGYVTIWSNNGSAYLQDSAPDWLTYRQYGAEQIPGTRWYKYTYEITCAPASGGGSGRKTFTWKVYIEDGEGTGIASTSFTVRQNLS